jgi:hypothetical protein
MKTAFLIMNLLLLSSMAHAQTDKRAVYSLLQEIVSDADSIAENGVVDKTFKPADSCYTLGKMNGTATALMFMTNIAEDNGYLNRSAIDLITQISVVGDSCKKLVPVIKNSDLTSIKSIAGMMMSDIAVNHTIKD